MYKIIICGACGRMGRELIRVIDELEDIQLVGAIEAPNHPCLGEKIGKIEVSFNLEESIQEGAVVVEFTTTSATLEHLGIAKRKGTPMVIGTTGFKDEEEHSIIEKISQEIPILLSPNMSVGINLMYNLVKQASQVLQGKKFDHENSVRGGTAVGEHTVVFAGNGERLEITHRADSRRIYALGAILGAQFITGKQKGLYDLQDALAVKETN